VEPVVTTAPQLLVATPERMNIEQKSKTVVVEENSVSAKDFFPNQNTMQEGSFSMPNMAGTQTPLQIRSEADQLIGHELIKSFCSLKQNVISHLSPSILYNTSFEKEAIVVSKMVNQCCNKKLLSQKPDIKVVQDLLTNKWIIIKANK
jgi:hypothetical protein